MNNLKRALTANALFSGTSATVALVFATEVSIWMGVPNAWILRFIGIGLAVFCIGLVLLIRQAKPNPQLAWTIVFQDLLWVLGSSLILLFPPIDFSVGGKMLIGAIALIVGLLALWQRVALRKRL
ncbi:MAG: hypothetical protein HQ500_08555 [Flavobacteriales bacterium]|nr:hypothetical protein [Flavobacteriales bacterium]